MIDTEQSAPLGHYGDLVGPTRATDNTERFLRSLIFSGELTSGDRLPPERELSVQLGTSRVTLRAALKALETLGYVLVKRGSKGGFQITDPAHLSARWDEWWQAHKHQIAEMLEFRRLIETEIASLAALRRTPDDIRDLEAAIVLPTDDDTSMIRWHNGFHLILARAAHNQYLEQAMATIRAEIFVPVGNIKREHTPDAFLALHREILEAVRDQDPARAAEAMSTYHDFSDRFFDPDIRAAIRTALEVENED